MRFVIIFYCYNFALYWVNPQPVGCKRPTTDNFMVRKIYKTFTKYEYIYFAWTISHIVYNNILSKK